MIQWRCTALISQMTPGGGHPSKGRANYVHELFRVTNSIRMVTPSCDSVSGSPFHMVDDEDFHRAFRRLQP